MIDKLLSFFRTGASRGRDDRRSGFPLPGVVVTGTVRTDDGSSEKVAIGAHPATTIAEAESRIDVIELKYWANQGPALNAAAADTSDNARAAAAELNAIKMAFAELQSAKNPRGCAVFPDRSLSDFHARIIMAALSICEVGFNMNSFNLWFPQPDSLETLLNGGWGLYAVAILASSLLPFFGHDFGGKLKMHTRTKWNLPAAAVAILSVVAAFLVIALLTYLRAKDHEIEGAGVFGLLLHAAINVGAFVASICLGFQYHHDSVELEHLAVVRTRSMRQLKRLQAKQRHTVARHDTLLAQCRARAERIRHVAIAVISEFIDFNLRGSGLGDYPELTGIDFRAAFRVRDFDRREPLALTPMPMTTSLNHNNLLDRQQNASDILVPAE